MLEELKELLRKHKASICIQTEGEGYSQTHELVIEVEGKEIAFFNDEITEFNL